MRQVTIQDYIFDLNKKIYLITPTAKFWQATLHGKNLKIRVGKVKDSIQTNIDQIQKQYPTPQLARGSIIQKIKQKLIKGYISNDARRATQQKKEQLKRIDKQSSLNSKKKRDYSGEYYQKGVYGIKLQVNQNRVKITRTGSGNQIKTQIKNFTSNQQAINYCLKQQQWLLGQEYKVNNSKFTYSFIEQDDSMKQQRQIKKPAIKPPSTTKHSNNFLSITNMTDDAISRSSRQSRDLSPTRSHRSADNDLDNDENQFKSTALGPPISSCIKVLLAQTWDDGNDPTGWYMSEKLDGVRCFWTGTQMFSRNGNRFFPPKFFTKNWPKSQLDGQLFIGRNKFSQTISAIKKGTPIDHQWQKVSYLVFDAPALKKPFHQRVKIMEDTITKINSPYLKCHAHRICTGFTDMFTQLQAVNKIKGQGLMLRDPNSYYQNRRSKSLLKVKVFYDDEATIIGYKQGTGRCYGMVGALRCRNTHGTEFQVGSGLNDDMRRHPPKIGTMITYKYQQFNASGKPRFPTFLRIYQPL